MKYALLLCLLLATASTCNRQPSVKATMMTLDEFALDIPRIQQKHGLSDFSFDTECIYDLGDLSALLKSIVEETFPEKAIQIKEELSADKKQFVATLSTQDTTVIFTTHADDDWLSDQFFVTLETLPAALGSDKLFYFANPVLTGQEAWYFCGTKAQLEAARKDGLPVLFPGEDFMETEEYKKYSDD